jgi:hypothetical protein
MYKSIVQNTLLVIVVLAFLNSMFYIVQGLRTPPQEIGMMIRIIYFSSAVVPAGVGGLALFLYWLTTTGYYVSIKQDRDCKKVGPPLEEAFDESAEDRPTT